MVGLCWTHFSDLKQRLLFGCPLNPNTGEEWVVNTLSRDGVHKVTDASWLAASHGIVYIFDPQLRWLFFVLWAGWHFRKVGWVFQVSRCWQSWGLVWSTQVCVWRWSTALRLQRAISCRRVTSLLGGGCQIVQAREPEIPLSQALGDPWSFFRPFRVQDLTWDAAKALPRMVHWGFTHVYTICGNPQKR